MQDDELLDRPESVHAGEELDLDALGAYFKTHLPEFTGPLRMAQFPSGYSNLTYLLRDGERELVLRRPPFGANVKSGHDMKREYTILSSLIDVYPRVPRPLLYCSDNDVLGAEFYVMERVKGLILRASKPQGLELTPELMQGLSRAFVDNLVSIHAVDIEASGLSALGRGTGYVQRQVEGWTRRYLKAKTDEIPLIEEIATWLADNMPSEVAPTLIHNDYKYDNLVLDPSDPTNIIAVLDWEMATVGDPLMDLGTSLGYWVDADDPPEYKELAFGLTTLPGNFNRQMLVDRYEQLSGRELSKALFYYVFALFKIIGIAQQIYYRYKHGYTHDERFARLITTVNALAQQAELALNKNRITSLNG